VLHNVYTLTAQQYSKAVDPGAPGARSTAAVLLTDIHSTQTSTQLLLSSCLQTSTLATCALSIFRHQMYMPCTRTDDVNALQEAADVDTVVRGLPDGGIALLASQHAELGARLATLREEIAVATSAADLQARLDDFDAQVNAGDRPDCPNQQTMGSGIAHRRMRTGAGWHARPCSAVARDRPLITQLTCMIPLHARPMHIKPVSVLLAS